jgi:hypothetical protein
MEPDRVRELIRELRGKTYQFGVLSSDSPVHRIEFAEGLTDTEIATVEDRFEFRFPPDLRTFLQIALPQGAQFPDWRSGDPAMLREWLDSPREGVLFDIQYNGFWRDEWGTRPIALDDSLRMANELLIAAPRLIPVYAHRMMPDEPHLAGNPVFSVHQTDIIHYGFDLEDYLCHEFHLPRRRPWRKQVRPIRFWDVNRFQDVRWGTDGNCNADGFPGESE